MRRVKNQKVIRRIADRTRKAGKSRNIIAVLAIALTTALFTTVFTVGGSIIEKQQEAAMRQVGGTSHASYKYLTQEEYEIVRKDKKLKEVSYRIMVGAAVNEELLKLPTEISYYEDLDAQMSFCYPQEGHMPGKEYEIVMSDLTLQALGLPCEIGTKVSLKIKINEEVVEDTFTLCGYFEGDPIAQSQAAAVSQAYAAKAAPTPVNSAMDTDVDADDYAGRIMADFNFASSLNLAEQVADLTERCGFPEDAPVGINWAYVGEKADPELMLLLVSILLIVLASGYLIIYNIFYINVYQDIRHYGLLKTIGTTGKQLRRMVYRQAYMLSLYGIPAGLIAGIAAGKVLLPVAMGNFGFAQTIDTNVTLNLWIFAGAAAFSFITVVLSCIRPCRIASRVSPIEAVRYTEGQERARQRKIRKVRRREEAGNTEKTAKTEKIRQTAKVKNDGGTENAERNAEIKKADRTYGTERSRKRRKVSPQGMALRNIRRNRKKVVIVVASLSLALVLLNSIYSLVRGFDIDKFVSRLILSDYSISDATLDNFSVSYDSIVTDGVTEDFLRELSRQEGIEEIGNIYLKDIYPEFSKEDYALLEERIFDNPEAQETLEWKIGGDWDLLDDLREGLWMDGKVYGIGKLVMEKLENVEGDLDWERFQTGKYVIASRFGGLDEKEIDFFKPGEKVTVYNEAGEGRVYEVLAVADMPYACGLQHFGMFDCNYILPEEEYLDLMGESQPMRTLFNVAPEQEEAVETWIADYCANVEPALLYQSKASIVAEFASYRNLIAMVGSLLAFILALIGILNFINTMVTSVLSRKQEFAMMEAVGMTGAQLREMLCFEGGYYALYTGIISVICSSIVSVLIVKPYGNEMFFFTWHFTLLPLVLCMPVLLLVVVLVPAVCHKSMNKVSVVERMRRAE